MAIGNLSHLLLKQFCLKIERTTALPALSSIYIQIFLQFCQNEIHLIFYASIRVGLKARL